MRKKITRGIGAGIAAIRSGARSFFGRESDTDALVMLRLQHRTVEALFAKIERVAPRNPGAVPPLVAQLADALVNHATIEERHFYPAVRRPETADLLVDSVDEHLAMKRTLCDLVGTPPADPRFLARLTVLKEQVLHHAKEEEEAKLFPLVERFLPPELREGIGQEMLGTLVDLHEREVRDAIRAELAAAY